MKIRTLRKLVATVCFIMGSANLSSEEIVTTKKDEPDAFYGLKIGGILSPSYNQRLQDGASGLSNPYPNHEPGFSTPWTLLTVTKEWKDTGVTAELWGELIRASQFTSDTPVDGGTKLNPFTMGIRRALIRKTWETNLGEYSLTFGMQELPHTYTQWKNYWRWRYVDKGPLESLGFAPAPADIGLGGNARWDNFSAQVVLSNGEGYRQIQGTDSFGFDMSSRVSYEPKLGDENRFGLHFFYRSSNFSGSSYNDCREGTSCLASDNNPKTNLIKDVRSLESDSYALETNFDRKKVLNFGLGYVFRKQKGGAIRDLSSQSLNPVSPGLDSTGNAAYAWLSLGWENFRVVGRMEGGTGQNGVLAANQAQINQVLPGAPASEYWNVKSYTVGPLVNSSGYSVHTSFRRGSIFFEWIVLDNVRVSLGYTESRNRDADGGREKSYIDQSGNERTKAEYMQQFQGQAVNQGIVAYGRLSKELTLWTTIEF
ncbi:hypothetical protein EHO59_08410 [Leptospira semungkisensis]|uniref:Porin n=2 Tax=Leptospira semungkisensis TaxID=2484985 RepID=A0A4R9G0F0_9LEPT|nr:hypothetical protein EHO59_08410 [Leptospira semungkisensis]